MQMNFCSFCSFAVLFGNIGEITAVWSSYSLEKPLSPASQLKELHHGRYFMDFSIT